MFARILVRFYFSAFGLLALGIPPGFAQQDSRGKPQSVSEAKYAPPLFIARKTPGSVSSTRYFAVTPETRAYFLRDRVQYRTRNASFQVEFLDSTMQQEIRGEEPQSARINYLIGDDPRGWSTDLPTYRKLVYRDLYSGIDAHFSFSGMRVKSEFVIAPGADPQRIAFRYTGLGPPHIDQHGDLTFASEQGGFREEAPTAFQWVQDRRVNVQAKFAVSEDGVIHFELGTFDGTRALIIDPVVSYSSYLGGHGESAATAVAADSSGNVYLTGWTDSIDFPIAGALQGRNAGSVDAFVAKLNAAGNTLLYATYIGGSGEDRGLGIAVDGSGNAYVTGFTTSTDFPTSLPMQSRLLGTRDAFVLKLNALGNALTFSTYLGGTVAENGNAIALDPQGNAYVAGDTTSYDFPTRVPFQASNNGRQDAFVAKISPSGALLYATYLGGNGDDRATAIAVDASGSAYLTGSTFSNNFPTLSAFQAITGGGQDAFVTKLSPSGSSLVYSTYLGGSGGAAGAPEAGTGIAVDAQGNAFIAGMTSSMNFPVVAAFQPVMGGGTENAFLSKLNPLGTALVYSTYFGGSTLDYANAVAVDAAGNAYVAGLTGSTDLPLAFPLQATLAGGYDAFVFTLNAAGSALNFSTYYGGAGLDSANGIALDRSGNVYVAGETLSPDFPIAGGVQSSNLGYIGGFVLKLSSPVKAAIFRNGLWVIDLNGNFQWDGPGIDRVVTLGQSGDIPVAGDWNGDGRKKAGIFRNGLWVLDYNGNGQWDGTSVDRAYFLGQAGDIPVVGDWNGTGFDKIGVFRNGLWVLDYNGNGQWDGTSIDRAMFLGQAGDVPVVGDWNGPGTAKVAVFRNGLWVFDYNGNGQWDGTSIDRAMFLGQAGDIPVVGDWNGSGTTKGGVFRNGLWVLDYNGNFQWDGTSIDKATFLGQSGDVPVVGDWNGSGWSKIGIFRNGLWMFDYNGNFQWDGTTIDRVMVLGQTGDVPVPAKW